MSSSVSTNKLVLSAERRQGKHFVISTRECHHALLRERMNLVKRIFRSLATRIAGTTPSSTNLRAIDGSAPDELSSGWQQDSIAERQHSAFAGVLRDLREGKIREDFRALAAAVQRTGLAAPTVLEVGAGGAWNSEVLARLVPSKCRYIGLDYSEAMIRSARREYPDLECVVGDA